MTSELNVQPACLNDVDTVLDILGEAAAWTAQRGFPNWPDRFPRDFIARSISKGHAHLASIGARAVATISVRWDDPMIWGPTEADAGYVHRLAVRRRDHGTGIGYALLDWAAQQVVANDRAWLRLDAATANLPLREYYERAGFVHCRDTSGEFRLDGRVKPWETSLYQRPAGAPRV